jgi:hypothetical protein
MWCFSPDYKVFGEWWIPFNEIALHTILGKRMQNPSP